MKKNHKKTKRNPRVPILEWNGNLNNALQLSFIILCFINVITFFR